MSQRERRGWLIVVTLFLTLLLVFGSSLETNGVFLTPLIKQFGWSRARASMLASGFMLCYGISAPIVGLILDWTEARLVMAAGVAIAGLAMFAASRVNSFAPMLVCYLALGFGTGASAFVPCSFVIANWFGQQRGLAMGATIAGSSAGGMIMTMVASFAIAAWGWRGGYVTMAVPMFVIVLPMLLLFVRSRPPQPPRPDPACATHLSAPADLPGLEVGAALRTVSFWMIAITQFCYALYVSAIALHLIPFLIGIGYAPKLAALVLSIAFGINSLLKFGIGWFADLVSSRAGLIVNFALQAFAMVLIFGLRHAWMLYLFLPIYAPTMGAPLVLVPLQIVDSLGLRRFGSISGLMGIVFTLGSASGPIVIGRIFDVTHNYAAAFELYVGIATLGALAALACRPLAIAPVDRKRAESLPSEAVWSMRQIGIGEKRNPM